MNWLQFMLVLSALLLLIGLGVSVAFATGALGSPATSKRKLLAAWQAVGGILIVSWGLYGLAWLTFTPAVGRSAIAIFAPGALMPTQAATQVLPSPTADPNAPAVTATPSPTAPAITSTPVPPTSTAQATVAPAGTVIPTAAAPTAGPLPMPTIDPVIAARFPQFTPAGTNVSVNQLLWLTPDATDIRQLSSEKVRIIADQQNVCPFNGGTNRCDATLRAGNFMVLNAQQLTLPGFGSVNGATRIVMFNISNEDAVWSGENQATVVDGNALFGRINPELGQTDALAMIQAISDRALGAAQGTNATFMVVYVNYSPDLGWTYQIVN
jgi:hypothetical protein